MANAIVEHLKKPAPKWFRKTKKAVSILSDSACVMLLAMGQAENSLVILWCRVGISALMNALEAVLVEDDDDTQ
jgi:hypothetical protein